MLLEHGGVFEMTSGILMGLLMAQSLFARVYKGPAYDEALSMVQAANGDLVVAGYTTSFGAGKEDFVVLRIAQNGALLSARAFGGDTSDCAYSVTRTSDGGYAIAGYTASFGVGSHDCLVIKLTPDDSLSWARTFGGTYNDDALSIIQTTDGGYAIAGMTESFGTSPYSSLVIKLTYAGDLDWARTFGGTDGEYAYSIAQTTDGGYAIAGGTESFGAGLGDLLIVKFSSTGDPQWARTFGGDTFDYASSVAPTSDGGCIVAGATQSYGAGGWDFFVLKLSSTGDLEWAKAFGGVGSDYSNCVIQTADGGYAVAGYTWSYGVRWADFLILKLSPSGDLQWTKTFGGTDGDVAYSVIQTSEGGYAVAGDSYSFGGGGLNFVVIRLSVDGNYPACVDTCTPLITDVSPVISSPSGGAICRPFTTSPSPSVASTTLPIIDVCPPVLGQQEGFSGETPFGLVCFGFSGGIAFRSTESLSIAIYSVDGRLVYSGQLQRGENRVPLNPGVYIWRAGEHRGRAAVR